MWSRDSAHWVGCPGHDTSWECESEQRKESNPPIGWEMERQFLQILRFSDFPFASLFHLQHSCLMDDPSCLKLELSPCRCDIGFDGWDPQGSGTASVLRGLRCCWTFVGSFFPERDEGYSIAVKVQTLKIDFLGQILGPMTY